MALLNPVSRTDAKKNSFGCMAKILAANVLFLAVFMLVSCRSTSDSAFFTSLHGGFELKTMEDDPSVGPLGKIEQKGVLVGSSVYKRMSSDSRIFTFSSLDFGIITRGEDIDVLMAQNCDLIGGLAYMLDYKPIKIMLGGGLFLGFYRMWYGLQDAQGLINLIQISHSTVGLGLMADAQYWLTEHFFVDLSGSYGLGLLGSGSYSITSGGHEYEYEMKLKTPTYMNVKLGLGLRIK